jgi:hypothetical protein
MFKISIQKIVSTKKNVNKLLIKIFSQLIFKNINRVGKIGLNCFLGYFKLESIVIKIGIQ